MLPGQASQTLMIASIMRARHQLLDAPVILDDPIVLSWCPRRATPAYLLTLAILLSRCDLDAQHGRDAQQVRRG